MFSNEVEGMATYFYEAIEINITNSGSYQLISNSTIDVTGDIYEHYFDPYNPSTRIRPGTSAQCGNPQVRLFIDYEANIRYILLVTTALQSIQGTFSIHVQGPFKVNFNRIGMLL
jgi:hypothetical protein